MGSFLTIIGLSVFVGLAVGIDRPVTPPRIRESIVASSGSVRLLAVGDINLGRNVGQQIIAGDTTFPFANVMETFSRYDIVIGNLECQLSDQNGETQHPKNNLIFTGPPAGAAALRKGGVTVVSTANNHALDYGVAGLRETIKHLTDEGVLFAGTGESDQLLYRPVRFHVNGVSFAFFACTDIMNIEDRMWTRYVAEADSGKLFPGIRAVRNEVDIVILSYHGGVEYAPVPSAETERFARGAVDAGVDLFLGHHPHVPQRVEQGKNGALIAFSLGNFVFRQPFDFWTQRSFALEVLIIAGGKGTQVRGYHCMPVLAGDQPAFSVLPGDYEILHSRTAGQSSKEERDPGWYQ